MGMAHIAMLIVASLVSIYLIWRGSWFALFALVLSQTPFWAGYGVSMFGEHHPITFNMFSDMAVSGIFVWLAYRMDRTWLIWLGVVFLCALIVDLYAMIAGMNNYLELHEALHYTALVTILGRAGVVRVDRGLRSYLSGLEN